MCAETIESHEQDECHDLQADVPDHMLAKERLEASPEPEVLEWPGTVLWAFSPGAHVVLPSGSTYPIQLLTLEQFCDWAAAVGARLTASVVKGVTTVPGQRVDIWLDCPATEKEVILRIPVHQPLYSKDNGWVAAQPNSIPFQFQCQLLREGDTIVTFERMSSSFGQIPRV